MNEKEVIELAKIAISQRNSLVGEFGENDYHDAELFIALTELNIDLIRDNDDEWRIDFNTGLASSHT